MASTVSGTRPSALSRITSPVFASGAWTRATAPMVNLPKILILNARIDQRDADAAINKPERFDQGNVSALPQMLDHFVRDIVRNALRIDVIPFGEVEHRAFRFGKERVFHPILAQQTRDFLFRYL